METQVYFTVRGGRRSVPCSFTTRLESLRRERGGQYMTFPMPDVMEHNQRRFNVRIDVEKESIPGFSVWHGALSSGGDSSGGPCLRWTRLDDESFLLADLSAGGLRLDVPGYMPGISPPAPQGASDGERGFLSSGQASPSSFDGGEHRAD